MRDLIKRQDAIDALKGLPTWWADSGGFYGGSQPPMEALLDPEDAISALENLPSAQLEITEDDVKEYCRKRCLVIMTSELYHEMASRWSSAQPKRINCAHCKRYDSHGHRCKWWNHGVSNVDWCSYAERKEEHD